MKRILYILLVLIVNCQLSIVNSSAQPKREFRSAWLTTVWAIDWPTTWGQSSASGQAKQQQELLAIVDSLAAANMNAVYFQVRGFSDAMYNSQYEPWSQYLTGTRGGVPSYDPLQTLIEYAHYKGIEVHAWLNPYRYSTSDATHGTLPTDYSTTHPEWIVDCGGIKILNPCLPAVKQRIKEVVGDIVNHYDVDGIIFDDYFYQSGYQDSYDDAYYTASGTTLSRANWRRAQVNEMVRMVHDTIHAVKPYVSFGIGPAGVAGKNNTSAPVYGVEGCPVGSDWQYNGIYSDPLAWYDQKTIDYMAPQLYWTIGSGNDYLQLSEWWSKMAGHFGRHMYASQDLSGLVSDAASLSAGKFHASEIGNQMKADRQYDLLGAPGCSWYSLKTGIKCNGFIRYIRNNVNQHPALVPMMSWHRSDNCLYVSNIQRSGDMLTWTAPATNLRYAIYSIPQDSIGAAAIVGSSRYLLGTSYETSYQLPAGTTGLIAVAVFDRYGNEYPARTMGNTTWGTSAATSLTYPANGATPLMPCSFTWTRPSGADSYFFQLSRHADFSSVDYECEVLEPSFYSANLEWIRQDSTYYWRVRTRSINATDTYSSIASFTVKTFQLISPVNGEQDCAFMPVLRCDSVASATASYFFEVATANSFAASEIIWSATAAVPHTQVADSVLKPSTNYFVRATVNFDGHSATSDIVKFRTHAVDVPVPVITSPADGATIASTEVTVEWQQQLSSGFRVEMATATSFASRVTKVKKVDEYTFSYTYTDVEPGTYYLRVKAQADGGLTDPSKVVMITIVEPASALEEVDTTKAIKVIENGQVLILRDGKRYTLLGNEVK